ncbi:Carboxylesterase type B, partial [Trinorchestia longiramus]
VVVAPDIRGKHSHDLMLGFTPWEGWSWLPHELHRGVENSTMVRIARTLIRNTRRHHLKAVLAAALQEYTDWSVPSVSDVTRRDSLLKMLGDSMLVAPLHRAADTYSTGRKVFVFMGDLTAQLS